MGGRGCGAQRCGGQVRYQIDQVDTCVRKEGNWELMGVLGERARWRWLGREGWEVRANGWSWGKKVSRNKEEKDYVRFKSKRRLNIIGRAANASNF